ncbi:tensin-3, partial [Silurus meridionalis]
MAEECEFDLNYITERIIAVSFNQSCPEKTYLHNLHNITQMLQSKHSDNYMVINISEPREELRRINARVLDVGWPEQHAPTLHLLCYMCKSIETWLSTHSEHVVLLHCRGTKDRIGVIISSYINLPSISSSDEKALDCYTMKRFYSDKMASFLTPSQKRQYVQMFGKLLAHQIKINSSPLLFHFISLKNMPNMHPTVCSLFVKVYQDMQLVCTTGIHQVSVGQTDKVYFALEPPQLLKGDIVIVCYHKNVTKKSREAVFRIQFHTGTLHGHPAVFHKKELDLANKDPRFLEETEVEVVFSENMAQIPGFPQGSVGWMNSSAVIIDYDTLDPLVHWDSYENVTAGAQLTECALSSVSSDSGLSTNSLWTGAAGAGLHSQVQKATFGDSMAGEQPRSSELAIACDRDERATGEHFHHIDSTSFHLNGKTTSAQRETNILEDEDVYTSAALVSQPKETGLRLAVLSTHEYTSHPEDSADGMNTEDTRTHTHTTSNSNQTHMWVKQQQLVSAGSYIYTMSDRLEHKVEPGIKNSSLVVEPNADKDDEFTSLALDIDQSIEQLNQLILDLDPEFEPVPTLARGHVTCSDSVHANGVGHLVGQAKSIQSGSWNKSLTNATNEPASRCSDDVLQPLSKPSVYKSSEFGGVYASDAVDHGDFNPEADHLLWVDLNQSSMTPAFPVTPPTPYVKGVYDFSPVSLSSQAGPQHLLSRTQQESRGYTDNMTHSSMSSDGDIFHSELTSRPSPCQRGFGSMRSVSTSSPLPNIDRPVPAHSWLDSGSNTPLSFYTPQPSPPHSLSTPNSQSSPRALPPSLDVGNLELSLLEAMEGLETLGFNGAQPPLLPQKRRGMDGLELSLNFPFSPSGGLNNNGSPIASSPSPDSFSSKVDNVKFVQDTSKFWYKPDISREQAIAILKDKEPGAFIVRDSHSFRGAYGLAMKVATPPPSILQQSKKVGDLTSELVRHFLIECTQKGVRLKGCPNEPYFGSLTALVCQHSTTPLALPCKLIIPDRDPLEELNESQGQTSTNSATELLKQGAACNVWFLGSVELESLTGVQAVQKATTVIFSQDPPATSTIVHFKVSAQGITLTDNQRKLFFRRHYPVNTVIFCALDPQDRRWKRDGCLNAKIFGFVARKSGSSTGNVCHLFAEHDPEQPASAIVNFVSKVMIGSQKAK